MYPASAAKHNKRMWNVEWNVDRQNGTAKRQRHNGNGMEPGISAGSVSAPSNFPHFGQFPHSSHRTVYSRTFPIFHIRSDHIIISYHD